MENQNLDMVDFAAVCCELHELMLQENEKEWPNNYRYDAFGGFPGWWAYVSRAATSFCLATLPDDEDIIETIANYAGKVLAATKELLCLSDENLLLIAQEELSHHRAFFVEAHLTNVSVEA